MDESRTRSEPRLRRTRGRSPRSPGARPAGAPRSAGRGGTGTARTAPARESLQLRLAASELRSPAGRVRELPHLAPADHAVDRQAVAVEPHAAGIVRDAHGAPGDAVVEAGEPVGPRIQQRDAHRLAVVRRRRRRRRSGRAAPRRGGAASSRASPRRERTRLERQTPRRAGAQHPAGRCSRSAPLEVCRGQLVLIGAAAGEAHRAAAGRQGQSVGRGGALPPARR
jgi:hypothetical protein